ncbi:MAG: aldo/keto reductase [Bacteroidales bacterium]|nr:aldo/keto reductase [Bacteroidales bacterium]MCF8403116.1 aldo/keto reductase [Bacteroidales bacterium]
MKYKLLGNSGLRVSELCLGTMTFGAEWGWGSDFDESKKVFDAFVKAGGNFVDTANLYTLGTSEKMLGEFIKADREHFVLATKYTLYDRMDDVSFSGNSRKNLFRSVEGSLERLDTDYIDLLWLHAWDFSTPVDEVMRSLDDLVSTGLVHYIGISDTPAWIVSQANTMAELKSWTKFIGLQIEYSLIQRSAERDLLPMAKALNIGVTPWAPLGGGVLTGKYLKKEKGRIEEDHPRRSEKNLKIAKEVVAVAKKLGVSPAQVAINWTRQQNQQVIPIIGASKLKQIEDNLACLSFVIPAEMMDRLNEVSKIELGFPHEFLQSDMVKNFTFGGMYQKMDFEK